jgi:hypothetical protein
MRFTRMKMTGEIKNNKYAANLCLAIKSWMPEDKVAPGIKRLFIRNIIIIYIGIISHHRLKAVLSFEFAIASASIS